jgi:mycoredoxin
VPAGDPAQTWTSDIAEHMINEPLIMYTTTFCPDCRRAKAFLRDRGVAFREVNIEEDQEAEELVLQANRGKRKVPTFAVGGRYFACSPFSAAQLASELGVPLNRS